MWLGATIFNSAERTHPLSQKLLLNITEGNSAAQTPEEKTIDRCLKKNKKQIKANKLSKPIAA